MIADARPGQVHDALGALQAVEVDVPGGRCPRDLVGSRGRVPDQPDDVVAGTAQVGHECRADKAGSPRDRDPHGAIIPHTVHGHHGEGFP